MKRRHILQLCLALLLCCPLLLKAQSNQTNYQFWIDDSKDEAVYGTMNGEDINLSLDVGSLNPGVHFYNIRAYETVGNKVKWGSLFRYLFCIPQYTGEDTLDNLQGYEYWLDNDYEHRVIAVASGDKNEALLSIDVSSLGSGLHFYNIRALETVGSKIEWGSQFRYLFCIPMDAKATPDNIQSYEYWLDNDYEHRISKQVSDDECVAQLSLDVSSFSPGVHFYNLRMKDTEGIWSASQRYMFSIPYPRQEVVDRLLITGYSYAFNDGTPTNVVFDSPVEEYQLVKSFSIPQGQPPMVIDDDCGFIFDEDENTATLSRNINMSFALFFKDQSDAMCSPATTDFVVQDVLSETIQLMACPGTASISSHANGGFSVVRFDVTNAMKLKLTADDSCCVRLYSPYSQLLDNYDASALLQGATREYEEGTYYAVVFDNSKEVKLSLGLADINALKPNISFDMDSYVVTISCKTTGPAIYYTLDGSIPTTESTPYIEPFVLDKNCTIKAIAAWSADMVGSVATLDIDIFDVANVTFAQKGSQLTLSTATEGATISYSVDGGDWATYSDVLVLEGSHTVQAYAEKQGYNQSIVSTYKFFYESPVVLIPQITYEGNVITITCETSDATVYYTIDGTVPTSESMVYTKPFTVSENCTIRAFAVKEGYVDSQIAMLEVVLNVGGYAIFNSSSGTLTFKYGPIPSGDNVFETENTEFSWNPSWDCSKLRTVIFDSSYAEARPTSTACWFNGAQNLTEIRNLKYLNTTSVTNMALMFQGCKKLSSIDVSHFDTESVTWIGCMFAECSTLTSVDVSNFNTSMVLSFNGMFAGCRKLATLDVSHFDTSNAYDMSFMFSECNSLLTIDVGNFNTSNVTNMKGMFLGCNSLQKLDVSHFDTRKVTSFGTGPDDKTNTMAGMFMDCFNLTCLDLSNFNTSNVAFMGQMFSRCSKLHTIYVGEEWTVENVTFSNDMFKDCTSLVGERGTCYNTSYTDISYARIDGGETAPGYLSEIGFVPTTCGYAMLDSSTGTLTFKYGPMPSGDNVWETENTRLDVAGSMLWDCSKIKQVIFDSSYSIARPQSTACWFAEAVSLKEIHGIEYLNTSNVTSMQSMFYDCRCLTNLDVSHFNTSNVQIMALMFFNCKNLTSLDVSNFDTKNVTNMLAMFWCCSSLTNFDVRNFDTSNVTDMSDMFLGCSGLTSLDVSHFDTPKVENMSCMFHGCNSLTELDVSNFSTTNVTDMSGMFSYCKSLTYLDLSNFDTQNVIRFGYRQDMGYTSGMFEGCQSLTSLDLSSFNTVKAEYMSYLFKGCNSLKTIYVGDGWATSNVIESEKMFEGCTNLVGGKGTRYNSNYVDAIYARIDGGTSAPGYFSLNGEIIGPCGYAIYDSGTATLTFKYGETLLTGNVFETDNTTFTFDSPAPWDCENLRSVVFDASFAQARPSSTAYWFYRASNLTQITGIEYLNTREVTGMRCMFDECKSLTSLDLSHFDTRNVTDMAGMFENCSSLTSLDMSSFDTRNVTDMGWMFFNCNALKSINLSSFNTSNVTSMRCMFYYCNSLETLNISHFDTGNVTNMAYMFSFCNSLSEIDVTHFKTDKVTSMEAMFQRCVKLKNVDVSHFETSNVTDMSYMFSICSSLTVLNLCRFNTAKVTNMNYMFQNCTNLKTIYAGLGWTTDNVTSSYNMFADCSSLVGGKGTSCLFYGYYYSDKTYARIDGRNSASGFLTGLFIGDVNDNGVVDLVDAVAMVNYILGTPSSSFKTISADINDDGEIDVFDVTMLINMILADSDEPASSRRAYDDTQEREPILLTSYGNSVYMGIDYPERFTAFQFDVTISSGVDLSDVLMVSNDNNHSLTFTKIGEDKYTVIGISLNNDLLKSANGKLVEMILSDQLNGDVMVSNIHFVTPEEEEMYFCDGMLCVVTGIASNSEECEEIIYDLSGRKRTKSRGLLGRGVYVINGKKIVIK